MEKAPGAFPSVFSRSNQNERLENRLNFCRKVHSELFFFIPVSPPLLRLPFPLFCRLSLQKGLQPSIKSFLQGTVIIVLPEQIKRGSESERETEIETPKNCPSNLTNPPFLLSPTPQFPPRKAIGTLQCSLKEFSA